jgi:DNA invertase Pin-like site-specific DNA recombinase
LLRGSKQKEHIEAAARPGRAYALERVPCDATSAIGPLSVLASVAQFKREVMLECQREGIAKAKREGRCKGRAPTDRAKSADILRLASEGVTRDAIAAKLNIGVASVYRVLRQAP